jgi:undecaprenyl pyrophosphate phosphatase UppP
LKEIPDKKEALVVGLAHGFAAIRGISRLGTTTGIFWLRNFKLVSINAFLKIAQKVNFSNFCIILGLLTIPFLFI